MQKVERPKAEKRKIHSRNEFELCYLRHQYFRRADFNPTVDDMKPYAVITSHFGKSTFFTYKNLFHMTGFELEDIVNIANIHLVSFLGLFSLEKMPEKYIEFVKVFNKFNGEDPDKESLLDKNKANFTMFLKQRMEDVVRVCRQKARNIKGLPTEEYFFYTGTRKPPSVLRDLIENYEKLGYKKLDTAVYKSIKKKLNVQEGPVFKFDGSYYVAVPVEQKSLSLNDFSGADMDPRDSLHNMTPEQIFFSFEEFDHWERKKNEFDGKSSVYKSNVIKRFIRENKGNPKFKEEIEAARRMLRGIS